MTTAWPRVALNELLAQQRRQVPVDPNADYDLLGARWYAKGLYIKERKAGSEIKSSSLYQIRSGDFVYNRLFAWKGSFAIADHASDGCYVSNEFPCFRYTPDRLYPNYLQWYFSREAAWNEALSLSYGATPTSRNRLKEANFLDMKIPLPPLMEQRRIVATIERLAAKIEEARKLRPLLRREVQALLPASIDSVTNCGYQSVTLEEAVDPERGITYGIVQAGSHEPDGIPYIRVSDMQAPKLSTVGMLRTSREIAQRYRRSAVRAGDVVFAIRATVGKVRVVPPDLEGANLTQGTARLSPSERVLGNYLFWSVQGSGATDQIEAACKGSTFREITLGRLRKVKIPLPPIREQHRIVAYLDGLQAKFDRLKALQAQTRVELDALLPSILDRAFKGEL